MKKNRTVLIIAVTSAAVILTAAGITAFLLSNPVPGSAGGKTVTGSSSWHASDKIMSECPFNLSDSAGWTFYPSRNLIGLTAVATDTDDVDQTFILAFDHHPVQKNADDIITGIDRVRSNCMYGFYDFEDKEIIEKNSIYYMKLKCDKRITVFSFSFYFEHDDMSETISIELNNKTELFYGYYDYPKDIRKFQTFNEETGKWEKIETLEFKPEEPSVGIPYVSWTELQVDENACEPYVTQGDITVRVMKYAYSPNVYNIYKEIESPQNTTITFTTGSNNETKHADIPGFPDVENERVRLYARSGDGYTDITPGDLEVTIYYDNEYVCYTDMSSNELGELEEGGYRFVIGEYAVDFVLSVQQFEAW